MALRAGTRRNSDLTSSVIDGLQIISEAVNHLPTEVTCVHPEIPWPQIRGFRNILVRQYFGVDVGVVRDVVQSHLPQLAEALRSHVTRG